MYALFYIAVTTGMRQGELLALRWSDVTLSGPRPVIHVRQGLNKGPNGLEVGDPKTANSTRLIVLAPDQVDVLQAHLALQEVQRSAASEVWQDLNLVFPSGIGSIFMPSNLVHRHWYVLLERSGCRRIRFHDLRHTYASMAIRAGMDVRLLADGLGHTDPAFTLRVYAHVFDRHRQGGALSLDTLLGDPIEQVA